MDSVAPGPDTGAAPRSFLSLRRVWVPVFACGETGMTVGVKGITSPRPPVQKGRRGRKALSESTPLEVHGPSSVIDPPIVSEVGGDGKLTRGGVSWAIF